MEVTEINRLRKKRNAHREVAKQLMKKIEKYLKDVDPYDIDLRKLKQFKVSLKETKIDLKKLDDEILSILADRDTEDNCVSEAEKANELMEEINFCLQCIANELTEIESDNFSTKTGSTLSSVGQFSKTSRGSHGAASFNANRRSMANVQRNYFPQIDEESEKDPKVGLPTNKPEASLTRADYRKDKLGLERSGEVAVRINTPYGMFGLEIHGNVGIYCTRQQIPSSSKQE